MRHRYNDVAAQKHHGQRGRERPYSRVARLGVGSFRARSNSSQCAETPEPLWPRRMVMPRCQTKRAKETRSGNLTDSPADRARKPRQFCTSCTVLALQHHSCPAVRALCPRRASVAPPTPAAAFIALPSHLAPSVISLVRPNPPFATSTHSAVPNPQHLCIPSPTALFRTRNSALDRALSLAH